MNAGIRRALFAAAMAVIAVTPIGALAGDHGEAKKTAVVTAGEKIGESATVALSDVIADPEKYAGKTVVFEGMINDVCQKKGCWMTVGMDEKAAPVRVTFKDYGFFVPMDSAGMLARAEGEFHIKVWTKEEADHLEEDGAEIIRNDDGTATEIGFVASGVELRKPPKTKESSTPSEKKASKS